MGRKLKGWRIVGWREEFNAPITEVQLQRNEDAPTVSASGPTRAIALCLAVMRAFKADRHRNGCFIRDYVQDAYASYGAILPSGVATDLFHVGFCLLGNPTEPNIEIDEDDNTPILRWNNEDSSLSLTLLGKGYVAGYLISNDRQPAWRVPVTDEYRLLWNLASAEYQALTIMDR
jgi:hypothetical protein